MVCQGPDLFHHKTTSKKEFLCKEWCGPDDEDDDFDHQNDMIFMCSLERYYAVCSG